jgi:hypothetical protein
MQQDEAAPLPSGFWLLWPRHLLPSTLAKRHLCWTLQAANGAAIPPANPPARYPRRGSWTLRLRCTSRSLRSNWSCSGG